MAEPIVREAESGDDFQACLPLFQILNPEMSKGEYNHNIELGKKLGRKIFVMEKDGTIIGVTSFTELSDPSMGPYILLSHTIVHQDHRGHKYGKQLLDFVENYARQHQYPIIRIITQGFRIDAHAFYQKYEYEQTRLIFEKQA